LSSFQALEVLYPDIVTLSCVHWREETTRPWRKALEQGVIADSETSLCMQS